MGTCDKCKKDVPRKNSALVLHELVVNQFIGFVMDRHLYPVDGCEGSPSRVKLVETNPIWKDVYDKLQKETNNDNS